MVIRNSQDVDPPKVHSAGFMAAARRHATRSDDAHAFVPDPSERHPGNAHKPCDPFAEELAEEYLSSATSGESVGLETRDETVPEDSGGPFVVSPARIEFALGTDASNPADAEVEAFPTATAMPRRRR